MPRIYDSASDPHDFCRSHMPSEKDAWHRFGMLGNGPDDRGNCYSYNDEHPDYDDTDYKCERCKTALTILDN